MKRKSILVLILAAAIGAVAASPCGAQICKDGQCYGAPTAGIQPFNSGQGFLSNILPGPSKPGRPVAMGPLQSRQDFSSRREFVDLDKIHDFSCCVRVSVTQPDGSMFHGSGVLIDYKGAPVILTNYHIVEKSRTATIRWATGETAQAITIGYHSDWDVAVLYAKNLPPGVRFAVIRPLRIRAGEIVTAYGFGKAVMSRLARFVARVLRFATWRSGSALDYFIFGQQNQQGDSGGPVFDQTGKLVGIQWGGDHATMFEAGYSIGIVMPRVLTILDELKVCRQAGWCDPPPVYRPSPPPAATTPVVPITNPPFTVPAVTVPAVVQPPNISIDMSGIEAALQAQAAASAASAASVGKLTESVAIYVDIQAKIIEAAEARRVAEEQKVKAAALLNASESAIANAKKGWDDAAAAGSGTIGKIVSAAGEVVASDAVAWSIGEWIATAFLSLTGIGGVLAIAARAGIPWITRLGLRQTVKLLKSDNHTDADTLLSVVKERVTPVPAPPAT